jgi:hypothetical protein
VKAHAGKRQPPLHLPHIERAGWRRVRSFQRLGQQIQHAVQARQPVLQVRGAVGQHFQRPQQHRQVDEKPRHVADREATLQDARPSVQQQGHRRQRDQHFPDQLDDPRPPPHEQLLPDHQVIAGDEAAGLAPLAAVRADDPHPAESFGRLPVDVLPPRADVAVQRPDAVDPGAMRDVHRRQQ